MLFMDTRWKCVLIFTLNRIMELVLDYFEYLSFTIPYEVLKSMSRDIIEV